MFRCACLLWRQWKRLPTHSGCLCTGLLSTLYDTSDLHQCGPPDHGLSELVTHRSPQRYRANHMLDLHSRIKSEMVFIEYLEMTRRHGSDRQYNNAPNRHFGKSYIATNAWSQVVICMSQNNNTNNIQDLYSALKRFKNIHNTWTQKSGYTYSV